MKKFVVVIAVVMLLAFTGSSFAQQASLRIAFVDIKLASDSYDKTKASLKKLEDEVAAKQKEAEPKKKELESLQIAYRQQSAMLSEEAKRAKEQEIRSKTEEYTKYAQEIIKNIQDKERDLTDAIITDIMVAAQAVGKEEKYDLVFDKKVLLLGGEDITQKVIKRLNAAKEVVTPEKKPEEKKPGEKK